MSIIKLFSPWHKGDLIVGDNTFSPSIPLQEAEGALWEYRPDTSILTYEGPKAWYSWEPRWHSMYKTRLIRQVKKHLTDSEWLHYAHPQADFRVPHITDCGSAPFDGRLDRIDQAVAVVSNSGGRVWFLRPGLRLRNQLITHDSVRLFGRREGWSRFRRHGPFSLGALPRNYQGELNWRDGWMSSNQLEFLGKYKVAVCLENSIEPFYFSEKFLNAAKAGCVPVYHAHDSVRNGILKDAFWIDPADYGFDPEQTIMAALTTELSKAHEANSRWLTQRDVQRTHFKSVWAQLSDIFSQKIAQKFLAQ